MTKRIFYGKIVDGILELDHKHMFREYTAKLGDINVELTISKQGKDPSIAQWSFLYANVYKEVADHFGMTIDDVDLWAKKKFMKDNHINLPDGLMLTKTVFDRVWLAKYVDSCIRYAANEGITCAPPRIEVKT
jgi:hypothetical protein